MVPAGQWGPPQARRWCDWDFVRYLAHETIEVSFKSAGKDEAGRFFLCCPPWWAASESLSGSWPGPALPGAATA